MRIIFMGSPEFAVPSLDALVGAGHELAAVYSQPPRPAGRGKAPRPTAVQLRAEALGIEVRTPSSLKSEEEQARFRALDADLAVVAAYGLILPRPILEAPKAGCINVHASLLPRWRGAAPIQRAILAGDETTGVTIMGMEEGLDTGPIFLQRELAIDGKNGGQVTERIGILGAEALLEWLAAPGPAAAQPEEGVTYATKVEKAETRIDWTQSAEAIVRQVLAFAPAPGAWLEARGERVKVLHAELAGGSGTAGEVLDEQLTIAAGEGAIRPLIVQRAGRAPMTPGELLRGFQIAVDTILP
ncbi:MAG: methionyl-tRNA formyltransferase [Sphingomicrobium sp.]